MPSKISSATVALTDVLDIVSAVQQPDEVVDDIVYTVVEEKKSGNSTSLSYDSDEDIEDESDSIK